MKKAIYLLPEILLLLAVLLYWESTLLLNPVAIILFLFLGSVLVTENSLLQVVTAVILALLVCL